jgi:hypothetical protein
MFAAEATEEKRRRRVARDDIADGIPPSGYERSGYYPQRK